MSAPLENSHDALTLRLLGGFSLLRPGAPGDGLSYEKGRALLAYVAMDAPLQHPRKKLAALFWPDLPMDAALGNLRLVLLNLRHALNRPSSPPCFLVDRESVRLDPTSGLGVDVLRFVAPLHACKTHPPTELCDSCLVQMECCAGLYAGEFMAGFSLTECPDFEYWLQIQREALTRHALAQLARLSDCHEHLSAFSRALPFALRYVELAPWDEEGYRRAMRQLALNGEPGGALAQYARCCNVLKDELGTQPSEATRTLADRIRAGELLTTSPDRGAAQTASIPQAVPPLSVFPSLAAERRHITVLYCELSVITPEGEDDSELAISLLQPAQQRWSEVVRAHAGYVVETYTGGLLAYFGYPVANENAVRHALQAALAITRDSCPGVEVRAGVHSGLVISGASLTVPDTVGVTTSLAIRLRLFVRGGEIALSGDVRRLVGGYFDFLALGDRLLSGVSRPVEVFRLLRESGANSRLAAATTLTPIVGRDAEIDALTALWREVQHGVRRIVLLRGEAGIGKSRLLLALKNRLAEDVLALRELRCFPEFSESPFHPFVELVESVFGFTESDSDETKLARLVAYINTIHPGFAPEAVSVFASLLSLPVPDQVPFYSAVQQREAMLAMVPEMLHDLATRQPILFVVEDLHWADPSTLELLAGLVARESSAPIFAIFTARPEFEPPWSTDRVIAWELAGLSDEAIAAIIAVLAPDIVPATSRYLVERADGIPLFAEELAKIAVTVTDDDTEIPATLKDLLAARLDGTGSAKATAQVAATIGRSFTLDLLSKVSPLGLPELQQSLHTLKQAELISVFGEGGYQFRHALVRDAAYQSQPRAIARATHYRIAALLEAEGGRFAESHPEILARHLSACGEYRQAIISWLKAGRLASEHSANREATLHFRAGLRLIDKLFAGPESLQLEFELQNSLGFSAIAVDGYASAEAQTALARALALCEQHEGSPDMFKAVWGLWASASSRVGYIQALELAHQLLRMAEHSRDVVQLQQAHFALGNTLFWQGEFMQARTHLECAISLYQPVHHASHIGQFGEDVYVTGNSYLSWVLEFLGDPGEAKRVSMEALAFARRIAHPFSLAYALTFAGMLNCRLRQPELALALANETLLIADRHGFQLWQIGGHVVHGWALALQSDAAGATEISQCVEATRTAMGGVTLVVLGPLADAQVNLGQFEAALGVIDEALSIGHALGDRHRDAELLCLKGESLLGISSGNAQQAAGCFQQALEISRQQQAKTLEQRGRKAIAAMQNETVAPAVQ